MTLLQRLRQPNDQKAWEEFCSLYSPLLENFFRSNGIENEDARDVSQEVLKRIAKAAPDFEYDPSRGKFRNWLFRIARNEMSRHFSRSAKRREWEVSSELVPEGSEASALEEIWDREYRERAFSWAAERVRPAFSETAWAAFVKTVIEETPASEVAEELGIKVGTVYISKSRIISRLRECIASINGETDGLDG